MERTDTSVWYQWRGAVLLGSTLFALALWVFWPSLRDMAIKWSSDPQYSHGYLVPIFSVVLLYLRRDRISTIQPTISWYGLPFMILGALGYVFAAYINFDYLAVASLLPVLLGIAVLIGGWPALRWSWPAIAFLIFMIPLPHRMERALGEPLQRIATLSSTWLLQTLGFPAFGEGNVIVMEKGKIAVVEACNGLSMLLTFAAITTGMAIVVKRPWVDKLVLLASTLPVAVIVNVIRISSNGVAMDLWGSDVAHNLFHDQAGWLMMPMAILILGFELWVLSKILVEVPENDVVFPMPGQTTRVGVKVEK